MSVDVILRLESQRNLDLLLEGAEAKEVKLTQVAVAQRADGAVMPVFRMSAVSPLGVIRDQGVVTGSDKLVDIITSLDEDIRALVGRGDIDPFRLPHVIRERLDRAEKDWFDYNRKDGTRTPADAPLTKDRAAIEAVAAVIDEPLDERAVVSAETGLRGPTRHGQFDKIDAIVREWRA